MRSWIASRDRACEVVVAAMTLALTIPATAGIAIEEKPASLITRNIVMQKGQPFFPLSDLARALGGSLRFDRARHRYEIQPGPNGILQLNSGPLSALASRQAPSRESTRLGLGGGDVMIDNSELVLLQPADPLVSLNLLARLLGAQSRFDAAKGLWMLPPGGPGSPLKFR